jgi:signal transduction histidine kinase
MIEPRVESSAAQLAHKVEQLQAALGATRDECKLLLRSLEFHERDRQLVGFEIHDGIVQDMTAALMFLETSGASVTFAAAEAKQQHERGVSILRTAIAEARRLIRGLVPVEVGDAGLAAALEKLVERFRTEHNLTIDYRADVKIRRLAPAVEMMILRIVQEALNNVWKHSQSTRAQVRLQQWGNELEITVRDWGIGFDPETASKSRYGLAGIRERARLLAGVATIDGGSGSGTTVSVRFTLRDSLLPPSLADRAVGSGDPTDP